MAITVKSVNYSKITTSKQDGIYTFVNPATIIVTYTKNNKTYKLNLKLEKDSELMAHLSRQHLLGSFRNGTQRI